jgi:hypothetical protein
MRCLPEANNPQSLLSRTADPQWKWELSLILLICFTVLWLKCRDRESSWGMMRDLPQSYWTCLAPFRLLVEEFTVGVTNLHGKLGGRS